MQENPIFYFIYFSISLALGSRLPYSVKNSSTFFLKMVSKYIMVMILGGSFNSRGNYGLSAIPDQAVKFPVVRFNGLVGRIMHTLSK